MGYEVVDGREVETTRYLFDALNMPAGHPTRSPVHTLFLDDETVLRTETSPAQIHTMEAQQPPASTIAWQDYFTDPRLVKLIEIALANNRDLRVSVLNIEQARAQFQIERSLLFPALNASASQTRQRPSTAGVDRVSEVDTVGVGITAWEIDFFGRISSLKDAALAQYLATEESRKAAQISLVAEVAADWLTLAADQDLLAIAKDTVLSTK